MCEVACDKLFYSVCKIVFALPVPEFCSDHILNTVDCVRSLDRVLRDAADSLTDPSGA